MQDGKFSIGILGAGAFAKCFIPLFQRHPYVKTVALAELIPERRREFATRYGITRTYSNLEEMLASDVDAVAIFTQRHLHGPQTLDTLAAGKHVYCAVPAAASSEELEKVVAAVKSSGLVYMSGETSYYYPSAIFCREKFRSGQMGRFVYGEGEYMHDMSHGFYDAFRHSGGENWKRVAGYPPMFYPTHSTSMILGTTGARLAEVSCLGYRDDADDGIFVEEGNQWQNPFSNQSALFRTSDGGMCRINEFRRVGHGVGNCVRCSLYGTLGSYEEQGNAHLWTNLQRETVDLSQLLACEKENVSGKAEPGEQDDFFEKSALIHPVGRLPSSFHGLSNGHSGSHHFLVDDFCRAVIQNSLPPNHVWAAARYLNPGFVAHQSANQGGKQLKIPDFGDPPSHWEDIDLSSYE